MGTSDFWIEYKKLPRGQCCSSEAILIASGKFSLTYFVLTHTTSISVIKTVNFVKVIIFRVPLAMSA